MWRMLQLADAAFPTGGFAHSAGLEAAAALGEVRDEDSLRAFVRASLWQAGLGALPFVASVHDDRSRFHALDREHDAMLTNHVQNRASRAQGRGLLSVTREVFARDDVDARCAHWAPVFGLIARDLDLPRRDALVAFAHAAARGVLSAAVRLGLTGPHAAQRIQFELASTLDRIVEAGEQLDVADAAQPSPLVDIWQGQHDHLYARLFQS